MIGWAAETLVATTILAAFVIVLRLPVARLFGPRAAYALWVAPIARLLLPPLPAGVPGAEIAFYASPAAAAASSPGLSTGGGFGLLDLLIFTWLAGALLFLGVHAVAHALFIRSAIAQGRRLPDQAHGPELIESRAVEGPIATGIIRRRILVPTDFASRLTPVQRKLALAHERLHHQRGDLIALAASLVLLALHWFNPLAHYAHKLFRRDLEAACDAQLVSRLNASEKREYARAIISCAASPLPQAICTLTSIDDLKRRLMMLQWTHRMGTRLAGTSGALALAAGGLLLTAPVQAQTAAQAPEVKTVKVLRMGGDGSRPNGAAHVSRLETCEGEKIEVNANGQGNTGQRARIVLCGKTGASNAELAAMFEKAVESIEAQNELQSDKKAEVLAQLRARIAELRSR
jgi:bla regulator protein blaR1